MFYFVWCMKHEFIPRLRLLCMWIYMHRVFLVIQIASSSEYWSFGNIWDNKQVFLLYCIMCSSSSASRLVPLPLTSIKQTGRCTSFPSYWNGFIQKLFKNRTPVILWFVRMIVNNVGHSILLCTLEILFYVLKSFGLTEFCCVAFVLFGTRGQN